MQHGGFNLFGDDDEFMGGFRQQTVMRGTDAKVRVTLTLEEAYKRGSKTIKYNRLKPCKSCNGKGSKDGSTIGMCPHCHGTGYITQVQQFTFGFSRQTVQCPYCNGSGKKITNPCPKCKGSGLEMMEESLTFDIPAGVTDNVTMRIPRKGNYCERMEGQEGDLVIYFRIAENDRFKIIPKSPYDLVYIDETPVLDCITGCEKTIKHIDGKTYKYTFRQGIEDGSIINLTGKGLAKSNGLYGDLKIVVKYKMPKAITSEERKLIEKLRKTNNFS
jgi:molecular chaperone DnaJ